MIERRFKKLRNPQPGEKIVTALVTCWLLAYEYDFYLYPGQDQFMVAFQPLN